VAEGEGGGVSQTVSDMYDDFGDVLWIAERKARTPWEKQFVADLQDKFDEYGDRMFFSDRQDEILQRITGDA
jgi:hypothetical protein